MTKKRGLYYDKYMGVGTCTNCSMRGYYEAWKSYLSEHYKVISVRHVSGGKTVKRCWLKNGTGGVK